MNKIFKVIWSKSKQCYIVVSEMAKNHSGKKKIVVASILAAMAVGADMSVSVQAGGLDGGQTKPGVYYATSIGTGANVGSQGSLAIGNDSYAEGTAAPGAGVDPSVAIGKKAKAVGNSSLAIGMNSKIEHSYGVAVGRNTEVSGDYGVGIGYNSRSAIHGIAMGEQARALKEGATTLGVSSRGYGKGAIAIGWQSLAGADVYTVGVPGNDINSDSTSKINDYNNWGDMSVGLRAMATGGNATALGRNAAATAANAVAIGGGNGNSFNDNTERTVASGEKAAAIGYNSSASGKSASALGTQASASAENAAAIGTSASASAKDTLAAGSSAQAIAAGATAVGKAAKAQKADATAVGSGSKATEANAVAIGKDAEASKNDATAIGTGATSSGGERGVAIGKGAKSKAEEATAIGADSKAEKAHDSALGTSSTASGGDSTAVGYLVNATGNQSFGAGSNTSASGEASVGIGYKASATGNRAISIGGNNGNNINQATAANSMAIGTGAQSTAGNATALGKGAIAKASDAMAFGTDAVAGNANATALGNGANAISTSGIAIGQGATVGVAAAGRTPAVDAANSIAIGKNAKVLAGSGSIALGADTQITASDVGTSSGAAQKTYPYMLTNTQGTDAVADKENGIVAIGTKRSSTGDTGFARRLTGVAGGVSDYDAVNLKQAKAIESSLKKGERHIKATSYTPDGSGTITLNYVDGENKDVSNETATITDVAKKSDEWTLGIKTTTTTGTKTTSSVSNITPTAPSGSTKKVISLEAGKNIAIDANGNNVKISTTGLDFLSVKSDATANKTMNVRSDTLKTNRDNDGATGQHSVAIGAYAEARSLSSTAIGNEVLAANNYATALGYDVANSGEGAVAIGKKVNSSTNFSTTIGYHQNTTDRASASVNIGYQSTVKSNQSVAIGSTIGTETAAQYSTAIGYKARTLDKNAIAIGSSNDVKEVIASGVSSIAVGTSAQGLSTSGIAIGDNAVVGVAEVKNSQGQVTTPAVDTKHSIALGTNAKVLAGQGSVAIGWGTEVGADDVKSSARAADADKVYPYLLDKSAEDTANDVGNGVVAIGKKRSSGDGQTIARRLTGLAGAVGDYDAVNLKQLKALESNEWLLRTQDGDNATPTDVTPASVQGETKKRVTLKAGDNIAIENNNGTVTIKAKDVVTSITSGNTTALTVSPSKGAVTITPNIASAVGAANEDGKLVTSGSVKTALDAKIDKTAEMHIKTGEYTVGTDGNASLIQQNGNNQDQSTRVVIKDIAKKSVVDGINTTVNTHTSQIANLTTMVGGKVSQTDFDTFKAQPITFTGDDNAGVARTLGTTLTVKGGANYTSTTPNTNIQVVKDGSTGADGLLVKLSDKLSGMKEIAGDGTNDLIIKNGDTKVTVKAPKDGNTGSIDFGDTKLVASNLDASIKYRANDDTAANAKSVKLADGFNYVASNDATTTAEGPKSGLAITAEENGKVTFGLDKDTRSKVDNAADKNLSNLSEAGNNKITNLAKAAAKETVKVADGINTTVDTDTTTTEGVTTYKVNANDTKVAIASDGLAISGGDLGATDRVRTYTLDLSDATKGKLTAVGNLANVIGGTTIATDGTVTGPTFNITNATGGTDTATTLKDAIDKLNATNEGQNTAITKLGDTVTKNYNTLSDKIDKAGETTTNALTEKGLDFYGNKDAAETDKVHRNLGQALKVKGAENFTREATATNNIDVVKNTAGDGFDVKLAENLGNIKEIAGDGKTDLVIKNGDTKVTIKAPKDGNTGSIDFGDTKLVTNNLDANISYKAGSETDKKTVKLQDGFNFVAGTGTVVPKHLEAGTASPTATTDGVTPKKGIVISTEANGVVNIGLDNDTRSAIDNAANQDLSNLTTAGKKVITDAAQGSVKVATGKNVTIDTETKDNVTTYTVNANDTLVTSDNTLVTVNGGTLGEDKVRTYTLGLSTAVTDKLAQLSAKNADGRDGKLGSETDAIASKDIAKADGLNGETATYKVNALRHGEAGSVVYTDADGNRIVKATDGNYYKATEVNANGVVKTPAENNGVAPVAVEKATIVATLVNTNGTTAPVADDTNKVATTKLTNIKEAAITATSNDAVTGRQLHGLKSDLATVLGGNSTVDANGTFTGPTYNITKDDGTNTTDPVKNVGDAIAKLDTRINNANTTLSTKGLDFYGNKDAAEIDKVHRNLGEALKVKGAENFTRAEDAKNNIDVVKNAAGDGLDVKLAENLGNIKEIAGNGTDNLVIKNGNATITVKPGKAGSTDPDTGTVTPPTNPSVDFGNTTLVVKNIEADITYRANNAEDADAHTVKLKKGLNFVAGTGTVAPKHLEAGTASPTATTDSVEPKKGIAISTAANGVVNIGLDNDTRSAIDNAANQDLSNLTTAGKKVITDAAQGAVKVAAGNNITVDTETKDNVTKYTVNGRDTTVKAAENGSVSVTGGTLNDKGEREYTVDLTDATKAQINRIDGIDTRLTTAENNITTLQGDMKQAKQDITTLQGDMKQAKTDITVLQGDMKQAKQDITNNTNNIATNTQNIKNNTADIAKNAKDIAALQGNSATKDLSNLTNAGKDVVTGLVNVVGTNGITVTNATDTVSRVKTFTAKLDDKVTFGKDGNKITIDGTAGTITAPNATINVVNTNTVQVGDTNKTNTEVTPEGITVTTKQPNGTVTSTVIIKDGTVSGLTNTKWDPTKVKDTDADRSKAATQGQMKDVSDTLQKGRVFAADTGVASTTVALGDTLAIKGGANGRLTDNNIGVELTAATAKEPATMTVRLAKDVKMKDGSTTYQYYLPEFKPGTEEPVKNPDGTVKYKTDATGNPIPLVTTTVNGEGITIAPVKELNKPSVTLTADGLNNGGNAIHNVGPGTAPNDAATVGQVSAAAGTLSRRVNEVGAHAAALAAMNPLSYDPLKKSQVMAGYGSYKGNSALALGVAHYANEDTLFNVGVSVGNGENMVNAGVTYRFGGEDSMIPERYKGGPISSVYVMQDEITALKAENARKDVENAKKEAENEEMKAQIKMLIERVTMLEAKK